MLIEIAKNYLEEGTSSFYGIEACNEVLEGHGSDVDPTLKHECLCIRAALLLEVLETSFDLIVNLLILRF